MLRFFSKQNKNEIEAPESRLRIVEWKVNLILAIVGIQLILTVLMMARDLLLPSTTTIVLCSAVFIAAAWLFRKQIPGLVKRMLVRKIVGDDSSAKESSRTESEESIR